NSPTVSIGFIIRPLLPRFDPLTVRSPLPLTASHSLRRPVWPHPGVMRNYLLVLLLSSLANATEQATRWNNLAALYHRQGQYAEAERLYRQAIAEWEQAGEGPDLARGLSNLGSVA